MTDPDLYSLTEAATRFGVPRSVLYNAAANGSLSTTLVYNGSRHRHFVTEAAARKIYADWLKRDLARSTSTAHPTTQRSPHSAPKAALPRHKLEDIALARELGCNLEDLY